MAAVPKQTPDSAHALGSGLTFGVVVALFAYGGLWLDETLGSKPWCLLVGIMLGLLGGTIHLLGSLAPDALPFGRRTRKKEQDRQEQDRHSDPPQPPSR